MLKIFALDYPKSGNSGGWSRSANHRPHPVVATSEYEPDENKSWRGIKRRKFTAFDMSTTPPTLIRRDHALGDLRQLGADIPKLYFDELGNMRGETDQLVMRGPS